jgi:mannitol 2-dehydrogenase
LNYIPKLKIIWTYAFLFAVVFSRSFRRYYLDVNGHIDLSNSLIRHDLDRLDERPLTAVGTIVAALDLRRLRGLKSFTILSCDNLPGNGKLSRAMVMDFVRKRGDNELAKWIETETLFPNCMVDRITPATLPPRSQAEPFSDSVRTLARETCGVDDDWPASIF